MRFGLRRGVTLAIALFSTSWIGIGSSANADIFCRTIPLETPALDYRTGDQMMAPAIPGGCYTKDYAGTLHNGVGLIHGAGASLLSKARGLCKSCGGQGCGKCFGRGLCSSCGGQGCGLCGGRHKLFGHGGSSSGCVLAGCGIGGGHGHGAGAACGTSYAGIGKSLPTAQAPAIVTGSGQAIVGSPQAVVGSGDCGTIDPACGGKGCGLCGGLGKLFHHGKSAGLCDPCGGKGCGTCKGTGLCDSSKGLCRACGGRGCALCGKLRGLISKVTHKGDIKYFVGAGGPVPLTPGYVPWVNPVRSPRDFFAFPPFSDVNP